MTLAGKTILITGAARRIGQSLAIAMAKAGADVILHHGSSPEEARQTAVLIEQLGRRAWVLPADLSHLEAVEGLIEKANHLSPLFAIVNNAAIFESLPLPETSLATWQRAMDINLTAPFLLSRDFARQLPSGSQGKIVNILDWRALRPGPDHFAYTISKAALAAMTQSMAVALAPRITVNGLALGAILPPSDGGNTSEVIQQVPAARWARLEEVAEALQFLLDGPDYITGEILYLDGGRHLV